MEPTVVFVAILLILILYHLFRPNTAASLSLPPGPRALPIIGNALDIPGSMPWKTFRDLSKKYGTSFLVLYSFDFIYSRICKYIGDVMLLRVPGQSIVVLGSAQAANDLLDKRSDSYSSRHRTLMLDLYVQAYIPSHGNIQLISFPVCLLEIGICRPCYTHPNGVLTDESSINTSTNTQS